MLSWLGQGNGRYFNNPGDRSLFQCNACHNVYLLYLSKSDFLTSSLSKSWERYIGELHCIVPGQWTRWPSGLCKFWCLWLLQLYLRTLNRAIFSGSRMSLMATLNQRNWSFCRCVVLLAKQLQMIPLCLDLQFSVSVMPVLSTRGLAARAKHFC